MDGERRRTLIGILLTLFLAALDQTVVATALPAMIRDLQGFDRYAWVATSYLLASVVALPVFGRVAEIVAGKWALLAAAAVFLAGSALAGLSPSMDALIGFRALQGIGGGGIFAVAFTLVGMLFPPRERGRYQGLFGAVFGLSSVVGPWLGGLLTDHLSWRWVFYVNMPVGGLALYFLARHMPRLEARGGARFDPVGAVALALWTVPLVLALSWGGSAYPWTSTRILGLFGLAAAALALFLGWERRHPQPLFDPSLFGEPTFRWASAATLLFGGTFLGAIVFLPLYLVEVKGFSATRSGLSLTPLVLGVVAGSVTGGQLASRLGRYKPLLLASTLASIAILVGFRRILDVATPLWEVVAAMVALGISFGPSLPLFTLAVQNAVPRQRLGTATSAIQFCRQMGSTVAVALLGTVLTGTVTAQLTRHLPPELRREAERAAVVEAGGVRDVEAAVRARFDELYRQVEAALRGDEQAYRQLVADPRLPEALRRQLPPGGVPAQVRARAAALRRQLERALAGDAQARAALLADPQLPAELKAWLAHPPRDPAARQALLAQVDQALAALLPQRIAQAEAEALARVRVQLERQAAQVAASVDAAVDAAITEAVRRVYGYAALLAALGFLAVLGLPDRELKGRLEYGLAAAGGG